MWPQEEAATPVLVAAQQERIVPESIFGRPIEVQQFQRKERTEAEVALRQQIAKEEEEEVGGALVTSCTHKYKQTVTCANRWVSEESENVIYTVGQQEVLDRHFPYTIRSCSKTIENQHQL